MFTSYLKIAWRHLLKNRQFTFLNLVGLSTGLACALLIYLWVHDELTFDHFHQKDEQLFQVMENQPLSGGIRTTSETPAPLAESVAAVMPEVEYATVTTPPSWFPKTVINIGDKTIRAAALFAGKDYFNIFSYGLMQGNPAQVLANNNGIVISEKLALSLFHTVDNVIGKTIVWQIDQFKKPGVITGIFKGTPANSSIQFDFVLSFDAFKELLGMEGTLDGPGPFLNYVVVKKGTNIPKFNAKLSAFMTSRSKGAARTFFLKSYGDNYLHGEYENGVQAGGRIGYVKLFSLIALFILLIAGINFMNLSTAKATGRMKEIGIRKVVGAHRNSLVAQYLGESLLMSFLALIVALLLVICFLPTFNEMTGKQLIIHPDINLIVAILGITLFTGLLAGSYPALYLSGFKPVAVLKGKISNTFGELWARKGLVVFQFTLSALFIVAVLVIYRQMAYVQTKHLGYDKDNVIYFDSEGRVPENIPTFLAELKNIPGVVNASGMVGNVLGGPSIGISWKAADGSEPKTIQFRQFLVNYGMMETLGLEMAAGRIFSRDFSGDSSRVIFNEAAIKAMGIQDPIGKVIDLGGVKREIVGVAKNFHFQSLHEAIKPLFFSLDLHGSTIMVKIQAGMEKQVLERLTAFYKSYNPGFALDYKFLDEDYQAQYLAEQRVAILSKYFAGFAVLISCLGLFGLAAFTAEKRRKEICIRKVLGATVNNVVLLLSKDFLKSVGIAIAIAIPLAWCLMTHWLNSFAYHIHLGPDIFLLTGSAMLLITLFTVSFQAIKTALMNPVKGIETSL
jgi:putative ABC transport system permease protein